MGTDVDAIVVGRQRERERERESALFRSLRQKKDGNFQTRKKATRNRAMSMAAISSLDSSFACDAARTAAAR